VRKQVTNSFSAALEGAMSEQSRFTHHAEGIVHELARGLYWTADDVTEKPVDHDDALAAVAKLNEQKFGGFTDWRLPEVEELFLLHDRSRYNPAIDTEFFPSCKSEWYWTSTDDASEDEHPSAYAWIVGGGYGNSHISHRDSSSRVRAVRGPARQSSASLTAEGGAA
jgi:hypothetical protein